MYELGARIRTFRKQKGWMQKQLAEKILREMAMSEMALPFLNSI